MKGLTLSLSPWGFEGEVTFARSAEQEADPLFAPFTQSAPIQVALRAKTLREDGGEVETLSLAGWVTERAVREVVGEALLGQPVLVRRYRARFADAARVLWRQHFPTELTTQTTLRQAIDAQRPEGVSFTWDWRALEEDRAQVFLGLGGEEDGGASFYDWLCWLVDRHQGVLEHDYPASAYRLGGEKSEDRRPARADPEELERVELVLPQPARHLGQVRNGAAVAAGTTPVANAQALSGVHRDTLLRTPLPAEVDRRVALEAKRLRAPAEGARLLFRRFPAAALHPGRFLQFEEGFSERLRVRGDPYRVLSLKLEARITEERLEALLEDPDAEYALTVEASLERAQSPKVHLPAFTEPTYPRQVEGKIVSPSGGDEERTWLALEDEATSLLRYEVEIPLWNKKVTAPFEPGPLTGRFFFPAYKHARVLLSLDLFGARVLRFLDWAANARTPAEGQGNRIVFGKRDEDGTYLQYAYADQKPALTLERTLGNDLQTLAVTEGSLKLTVREDPAAQKVEPKFDVTLQVEAAKGQVSAKVRGGISELSGKLETAVGGSSATLTGAVGELKASLEGMEAGIRGQVEAARAELEAALESVSAALDGVTAAVGQAKSEILTAATE